MSKETITFRVERELSDGRIIAQAMKFSPAEIDTMKDQDGCLLEAFAFVRKGCLTKANNEESRK